MEISKELYNYAIFNSDNFITEYIGINFLDTINSKKMYYQPNYKSIKEDKVEFAKKVVKEVVPNKFNQSILNMIDYYSGVLLDISIKNHHNKNSVRFNIRCPHKAYKSNIIEQTVNELGFGASWNNISKIINKINQYKNQKFDSLFIVGFSIDNQIVTSIKYYFDVFNDEIITDYNNFEKYHSDDESYFFYIMKTLNISQNTIIELKKFFDTMNKHKAYIAFIGIDYDLNKNKIYKIYYKINENDNDLVSEFTNIINTNGCINNDIEKYFNNTNEDDKKFEYIAIAFSEECVIQYQIYLSEREQYLNEIYKK